MSPSLQTASSSDHEASSGRDGAGADQSRAIILSTSSKKDRLEGYLDVGDIELTKDDVKAIDDAGAKGELWDERKQGAAKFGKIALCAGLGTYAMIKLFL